MNVMMRSDNILDVAISATSLEYCGLEKLDRHIRTLQVARRWLVNEEAKRTVGVKGTTVSKEKK